MSFKSLYQNGELENIIKGWLIYCKIKVFQFYKGLLHMKKKLGKPHKMQTD